jgi:FkbM family methyltransferase
MKRLAWKLLASVKRNSLSLSYRAQLMPYLNFTITIDFGKGTKTRIPILGGIGYSNITPSEPWMITLLAHFLGMRSGIFVDIGANIGQTLIKLRQVSPTTPYVGFEPNPTCAHYLLELIRANNFKDTTIIPAGVFDKPALLELQLYSDDNSTDSGATVVQDPGFRPQHPVVQTRWVPLFDIGNVPTHLLSQGIGVIKIDVEGAEQAVLNGLAQTLRASRPPVLLEILPMWAEEATLEKNAHIEAFIRSNDYRLLRVIKAKFQFVRLMEITEIGSNQQADQWDYVALPNELMERVSPLIS